MIDTLRVARGSTRKITAFFVDSAGNGVTGLTLAVRVWRESDGFFLQETDDGFLATVDDFATGDAEVEELDASLKPGYYEFAFAIPDADDVYTIRIDGSASAANRFLTSKVIADLATTGIIATYDGTGYADDVAPATQEQLAGLAGGLSVPSIAESSVVTQGTETLTYEATHTHDGTNYDVTDSGVGIGIDFYLQFDLGGVEVRAIEFHLHGNYEDAGAKTNSIAVQSLNWMTSLYETVHTLTHSTTQEAHEIPLNISHTGESGGDPGLVRLRFVQDSQEATNVVHIDHISVGGVTALRVDPDGYVLLSDGTGTGQIALASGKVDTGLIEGGDATDAIAAAAEVGADASLVTYDGPTNAEMEARTRPTGDYFDQTTDPVELLDSGGTAGTSAAELVDDVWDEDIEADHQTGDSAGEIVSRIGTFLGTPKSFDAGTATIAGMLIKIVDDNGGDDFDATTDSLQAIRDRGDAAWTTASNPDGIEAL